MNIALPKPKAVIFDWDNTLADTEHTTHKAFNLVLEKYDKPAITFEQFQNAPAVSIRDGFPSIFGKKYAKEAAEYFTKVVMEIHLQEIELINGTQEALELIRKSDVITGVVSNKLGSMLRRETAHLDVSRYFKDIVGSYDASADKPSLEPVKKILDETNIVLGPEVWFVGDSIIDMQCAKNGNFTPIFRGSDTTAAQKGIKDKKITKVLDLTFFANLFNKYI